MKNSIPVYDIQNFKAYKNDGILISRFGAYAQQHQHLHSAHRHRFFHLVFFTAGSGSQQIDFKKFDVAPGLVYFMVPGQVHSWSFTSQPDGYLLNFSADYFNSFLLKSDYLEQFTFFAGQVFELPESIQEKIVLIFEEMLSEAAHEQPVADDLIKTLLLKLLITISRVTAPIDRVQGDSYGHTLLKSFQKLIELNYNTLRLPKQYAELLYITPNHLNSLCNDLLGISAGTLIRERVMLEAKRLLINVKLMVAEIAEQLNFADQSYFVKFFKKYEGITPEKFRKLNTLPDGNTSK